MNQVRFLEQMCRCYHSFPKLYAWGELDSSTRFCPIWFPRERVPYEVFGSRYILESSKSVPHYFSTGSQFITDGGANKA